MIVKNALWSEVTEGIQYSLSWHKCILGHDLLNRKEMIDYGAKYVNKTPMGSLVRYDSCISGIMQKERANINVTPVLTECINIWAYKWMAKQLNASPDSKLLLIHHRGLVLLLPMDMQPPGKCDSIADDLQSVSATNGHLVGRFWWGGGLSTMGVC